MANGGPDFFSSPLFDADTEALARRQAEIGRPMSVWDELPEIEREYFRKQAFYLQIMIDRGMEKTRERMRELVG